MELSSESMRIRNENEQLRRMLAATPELSVSETQRLRLENERLRSLLSAAPVAPSGGAVAPVAASLAPALSRSAAANGARDGENARTVRIEPPPPAEALPLLEESALPRCADLAFVVDCTESMNKFIDAVYQKMADILKHAAECYPTIKWRVAFAGYRDFADEPQFEILPFTEDVTSLCAKIRKIEAKGGSDPAEDVLGGLRKAAALEWRAPVRLLLHFADMPNHGRFYQSEGWAKRPSTDRFPEFDLEGRLGKQTLESISSQRIDYYFAEVRPKATRVMSGR
jgi:hypothetical protein